jgi:hypothetical protein
MTISNKAQCDDALSRLKSLIAFADVEGRGLSADEKTEADDLLANIRGYRVRERVGELTADLLGPPAEAGTAGLYAAMKSAGYDRQRNPIVRIPPEVALGIRLKAASFDGDYSDAVVDRRPAPGLGEDARFLFAAFPAVSVADDTTTISSFRQQSRTLPSLNDVWNRAIDAVTTKAEVDTQTELVPVPLLQVAAVELGVPNVMLSSASFRSWIDNDLAFTYKSGVDDMVKEAIQGAGAAPASGGSNIFEQIAFASSDVQVNGYRPSLVALSPGDALALKLLMLTGGDSYVFSTPEPTVLVTATLADSEGFVADASSAGVLYATGAQLQSFEENSGSSNSSTVRYESHAAFAIERVDAIVTLEAS